MTSRHKRNHVNGSHYHHSTVGRQQHGDLMAFHSEHDHMSLHPHDRTKSQRHRRDLSKCTSTHKQRRRLSIGCSRDDIFEVSPQCSETGDEGKGKFHSFFSWFFVSSTTLLLGMLYLPRQLNGVPFLISQQSQVLP